MLTKQTRFARYSKGLCWTVAGIWLVLAILSFTGGGGNSVINGALWLLGSAVFAFSAFSLGKSGDAPQAASTEASD